ncbi:PUTATIVE TRANSMEMBRANE PROTEIN [hydrothermal vent metagenome]|uniref:PUTATIVE TRANSMEMBRANE PROTEIN n=1 Tax=hydrothermal vent metagenome TaxID=652676 RepID=A0A1W1BR08_9ZZZZ
MAEKEEEIVILEDSDADKESESNEEQEETSTLQKDEDDKKRLLLFGGIAILLVLLIMILTIFAIMKKKKEESRPLSTTVIEQQLQKSHTKEIEPSKLEHLIAKANYLYTNGQKDQALKLYEYIAQYSEAISQYNLGVARLKNRQYKEALQSFKNAINNGEKRCVSAINAAVCSLYLGEKENFRYYIDLAEAYLPYEVNAPLYPYYYSLIQFYRHNYYEALVSITKVKTPEYQNQKKILKAKLAALFESDYDALEGLEDLKGGEFDLAKAELYARVGDLILAKSNFQAAKEKGFSLKKSNVGLILTKLKLGHIKDASLELKEAIKNYDNKLLEETPIKVFLKKALFDPLKAQEQFRKEMIDDPYIIFSEIFYFSPYKIFNANQTINYIRKGNATSYIDSIDSAKSFLKKSVSTSKVNKGIAQAIKLALHFRIRQANTLLQKLVKIQPKHSILHYNLGLTYAQLGDMHNAYKHFIWSYHLDAKNYLSGIYAYMASKLIHKEDKKLLSMLKENLADEDKNEKIDFYEHLLYIAQGSYFSTIDWLENSYKTRPIYLILSYIIALHMKKDEVATKSAKELIALLPHEILPHILYIAANFKKYEKPLYAQKSASYLAKQSFNFKDLYYGAEITRYTYAKEMLLTGHIAKLVTKLQHRLNVTVDPNITDTELALALALFYNKNFEKSYLLYNHLIDEEKIQDAKTLFLAAISSIAAKHHANAIALLELSKLKDRKFQESRYALGLLYLEIDNPRGANIEFTNLNSNNFHSKYFNFDIDLQKLTFKKLHPKENN